MIQIPYQRRVGPATAPGIARIGSVEGGGQAIAQGVAVAGDQLRQYGQGVVEQEKRTDRARVALALTQSEEHWSTDLEERKRNLAGDGEGFTGGVRQDHEEWASSFLEEHGGADPEVRAWLQERLADQRGRLMIRAMDIEGVRRGLFQGQAVEETTKGWAGAAYKDPGGYEGHVAGYNSAIDLLGLDPAIAEKLRAEGLEDIALATGLSLAERDPARAYQEAMNGSPWASQLSAPKLDSIATKAQAELKRIEAQARADAREAETNARLDRIENGRVLERTHADNLALAELGQPPRQPLTRDDVAAAVDPDRVDEAWKTIQAETSHSEAVGAIAGKSPAEIAAILDAERPDPSSPGFAADQERFTRLQTAVVANAKNLATDPAGYVMRLTPRIGELLATGEPEDYAQAVTASLAEQARLGVPPSEQRPLPAAAVENLARTIGEAANPEERLGLLTQYTAPLGDGPARDRLLRDFEDEGLPKGTRFAVAAAERGDRRAAVQILTSLASEVKPTGDQKRDLGYALDVPDAHDEAAGMVANWTGDATRLRDRADERAVVGQLAGVLVASGASPADAVEQARAAVHGKATRPLALDWLGAVTITGDADEDRVTGGLQAIRAKLPELFGLGERQDAIGEADNDARLASAALADVVEDWVEGARWIDHPGGGFALAVETADGHRRLLPGRDGKPLVVTLDHVLEAGAPGPARQSGQSARVQKSSGPSRPMFGDVGSGAVVEVGPLDWYALRDAIPVLGAVLADPPALPVAPGAGKPGRGQSGRFDRSTP